MEQLKVYVDELISDRCLHNESVIYNLLYEIEEINSDIDIFKAIIPSLRTLCENGKLQKDIVYLSLLAARNSKLALETFLEYDKVSVTLDNLTSQSIFEYCIFKKQHWFTETLNNLNTLGKQHFSTEIYKKLLILRLFNLTNVASIDTTAVKAILNEIQRDDNDILINFYINKVENAVDLVDFISSIASTTNMNVNEIIYFTVNNSNIKTISMYMDLKQTHNWESIIKQIDDDNLEIFKAFAVVFSILMCLNICDPPQSVEDILRSAEAQLLSMRNKKLQLEVIKTIFTLLFLSKEQLQDYSNQKGYVNEVEGTSIILHFLKSVFQTIKLKNLLERNTDEFTVFAEVDKHLIDALWRHELVTTIKTVDSLSSKKNRLLSYMLAAPESLIYMCLKKGNFERALQVIQVRDVSTISLRHAAISFGHILHNYSVCKLLSHR